MPDLKIMPSILAANRGFLDRDCKICMDQGADGIHVDVMDGHFVPNLSYGPDIVEMARTAVPQAHLNVHLMITNPHDRYELFTEAGADTLLVHSESEAAMASLLPAIRKAGTRPGIVLNPDTPVDTILPFVDLVDEVLFMTVFPGFGGQEFIPGVMPGIRVLRDKYPDLDISVDGGLNRETCKTAFDHGANLFHIGSHLFKASSMQEEILAIRTTLLS